MSPTATRGADTGVGGDAVVRAGVSGFGCGGDEVAAAGVKDADGGVGDVIFRLVLVNDGR